MKNALQISYWTIGGFENAKPIAQALREAKEMGFDGVELAFDGGCFGPGIGRNECATIRQDAERLGMPIRSLASGAYWGQSLSSPDAATRKKAVAFTKEYIQVANWIGARVILVVPGAVAVPWDAKQPVVPYQTAWKNSTASLRACVKTAEKLGVTVALENVWNWFLADPIAMKTFIDQFKSRRIAAYLDVANCLINGYPEHWIEILGRRVAAVHVKNFARENCGGTLSGFGDDLLKGAADWKAVVAALKKINYKGPITGEMLPFSRLPNMVLPDMALAKDTAGKMRSIFG